MLPNDVTVTYNYKGSGGLLQLYWGNAFKICKGLSIGLNVSYLFGRLNYTKTAEFDGSYFFHSMVDNTTNIDGLYLSGGLQYFATIKGIHTIGLGVVYENSAFIKTRSQLLTYNYEGTGASASPNDTVDIKENKGRMQTPQSIGGGFSYQYRDKWLVTADVTWQDWSHYYLNENNNGNLQDAITVSAGFQFVPNSASVPVSATAPDRFSSTSAQSTTSAFLLDSDSPSGCTTATPQWVSSSNTDRWALYRTNCSEKITLDSPCILLCKKNGIKE